MMGNIFAGWQFSFFFAQPIPSKAQQFPQGKSPPNVVSAVLPCRFNFPPN
jgi:hypothetical protein